MKLKNKTAIITGAANGLGKATAIELAQEGAKVALIDIDRKKLDEVCNAIRAKGSEAMAFTLDITKNAEVKAVIAEIIANFEHIDILVNNAGAGWNKPVPFKDISEEDWEWILELNIKGTLYVTRAVINNMVERKYGKIINVASIAAKTGIPKYAVYSASKGAIVSFTKALAMELGPYNINVNCISPGLITNEEVPPPTDGNFLGRRGTSTEIALLIAFLVSDDASYITGVDYLIDGGRTLGPRGA